MFKQACLNAKWLYFFSSYLLTQPLIWWLNWSGPKPICLGANFGDLCHQNMIIFFKQMPSQCRAHNGSHIENIHNFDVITGAIASQITSLTIVYSTVYSDADQRIHQSSASLAFVRGINRRPVNSPHKWPVTRKMLPFDDVIMLLRVLAWRNIAWWRITWRCFPHSRPLWGGSIVHR